MKHYTRIEGLGDASAILMMRRVRSIVYQGQWVGELPKERCIAWVASQYCWCDE